MRLGTCLSCRVLGGVCSACRTELIAEARAALPTMRRLVGMLRLIHARESLLDLFVARARSME